MGMKLAVALALIGIASTLPAAEKTPAKEPSAKKWAGKILVVVQKQGEQKSSYGGGYFENVRTEKLGDRYFLVGTTVDVGNGSHGIVMWIPMSEIVQMSEYDSVEHMKKVFGDLEREKLFRLGRDKPEP